jgi:hypothetical protein
MHHTSSQAKMPSKLIAMAAFVIGLVGFLGTIAGAAPSAPSASLPFGDEKVEWHGFDRYDFLMDEQTLAITPFKAPASEGSGVKDPVKRAATMYPRCSEGGGTRQSLVLARLLLGPPTSNRNRIA